MSVDTSVFGGVPWMRAGETWPRYGKKPLSHLATINLAQASEHDASGLLPRRGLLRFWFVQDQSTCFDPKDAGWFRVDHLPDTNGLAPAQVPSDVELFAASHALFDAGVTLPNSEWIDEFAREHVELGGSEGYDSLADSLAYHGHRLLGHASPVQGPMEGECHDVLGGTVAGNEPKSGAQDWILLMQLETDDEGPGWIWGDAGALYFWIRKQDLAAMRFDRVWCLLQCS